MSQAQYDYESLKKTLESVLESLSHLRIEEESLDVTMSSRCTSGAYSDVYQAILVRPGCAPRTVAVKELRSFGDNLDRIRVAIRLAREIKIWAQLSHPNVLQFLGYHLNQRMSTAWLISPYIENGNLSQFIKNINLDSPLRIKLIVDTARGLAYLHAQGICHGDMKPANILVTDERTAVIADFGLSQLVDNADSGLTTTKALKGSLRYLSPELLEDGARHTLRSDVWAFGCVMMEVLTGLQPFPNAKNEIMLTVALVQRQTPVETRMLKVAKPIRHLLQECWQLEPSGRPTMPRCAAVTNGIAQSEVSSDTADNSISAADEMTFEESQQTLVADNTTSTIPALEVRSKVVKPENQLFQPGRITPRERFKTAISMIMEARRQVDNGAGLTLPRREYLMIRWHDTLFSLSQELVDRGTIRDMQFSPNGQWLATCNHDWKAVLWKVDSDHRVSAYRVLVRPAEANVVSHLQVAWSPNNLCLLTRTDRNIKVWATETGFLLSTLAASKDVRVAFWLRDCKRYVSLNRRVADIVDFQTNIIIPIEVPFGMETLWASPAHDEQHLWILLAPDEDTPATMKAPHILVLCNIADRKYVAQTAVPRTASKISLTLTASGTHFMLVSHKDYTPPELWKVKISGDQIRITEGHSFRLDDAQERVFKGPLRIGYAVE
ncbi:hypothetical protein FRC04_005327 [Tulasnella sp. 424]|nr:hypothetical protein FRC04_005327 [Tulasnella sp. 424]